MMEERITQTGLFPVIHFDFHCSELSEELTFCGVLTSITAETTEFYAHHRTNTIRFSASTTLMSLLPFSAQFTSDLIFLFKKRYSVVEG